jgi:hypothetical protein
MGEEAKTARRTDSLQKEAATMSAPNEKKSEIDETRGDHIGSAGRREPLLTSMPGMFRGDADLREPRYRLLNDADNVPEPSLHAKKPARGSMLVGTISFSTVAAILFVVWGGIEIMPAPERIPIPSNPAVSLESGMSAGLAPAGTTRPITSILIGIQDRQALVNEPIPLGGMLFGAGEEAIHITGLTEGSRLSAGGKLGPSGWQIPPRDLAGVLVIPPASFIGTMRTVIQLRASGNVPVDTQAASYEWVAKLTDRTATARPQPKANDVSPLIPQAGKHDPQRLAQLVKRGVELLRIGDFAAARLVLRPAAEAGDAEAALLLGATFDPAAVADLGALGLAPDPNVARAWYQRAMDAGSVEASRRIERLTRTTR